MLVLASILVPVLVTQVVAAPHRWHHHHHHGNNEITSTEVDISTPPAQLPTSTVPIPVETPNVPETEAPETETEEPETETPEPTETETDEETTPSSTPTSGATPGTVTNVPTNAKFDYQLGGGYTPPSGVQIVSRDHTDTPASGLYNICYINAFQTQPDAESFWKNGTRDSLLLRDSSGEYFGDAAWEGEIFLDTSTEAKRAQLATIVNGWIDECASKGFKAVEPDNLDTFTRSDGLLTKEDNLAFSKLIATYAHSKGLAIAQKNTAELTAADKADVGFDFAVAEECEVWEECGAYTDIYGGHVLEIEYTDSENAAAVFKRACDARKNDYSIILRDRLLVAAGGKDYHFEEC